jgi:hypothetical protein
LHLTRHELAHFHGKPPTRNLEVITDDVVVSL